MTKTILNLSFCLLLGTQLVHGQSFNYQTDLPAVEQPGFVRIALNPEVLGKLNKQMGDLRILDQKGVDQPYVLRKEKSIVSEKTFKTYEIVDSFFGPDTISYLVIHNANRDTINNLSFIIQNTEVRKRARLSGSNDRNQWYVIKDNYLLHNLHSKTSTSELRVLNFPLSDYAYFKLEINDVWDLPIDIRKVGFYDHAQINGARSTVDYSVASQHDSADVSSIKIAFSDTVYLEQLQFNLSGAEYYARPFKIKQRTSYLNAQHKTQFKDVILCAGHVTSNSDNVFDIHPVRAKELLIEIDNGDNQPLNVLPSTGSCKKRSLLVNLKPNENYTLHFGSKSLKAPNYDLVKFTHLIPQELTELSPGQIELNTTPIKQETAVPDWLHSKYLIWGVIVVVGVLVGAVTLKLVREMGSKE